VTLFCTKLSFGHQSDYKPIVLSEEGAKELNKIIHRDYKTIIPSEVKKVDKVKVFYEDINKHLADLFLKGDVLADDELTNYLKSVLARLTASRPSLKENIRIFVLKSTVVNAYTYPEGTIILTTGLLSRLSNESQLAFIIGHELGHYTKQHGLKRWEKNLKLEQEYNVSVSSNRNSYKLLMSYSQENELESDAFGIELATAAGYNGWEGIKAQKRVEIDSIYNTYQKINYSKVFTFPDFNLDSTVQKNNKFTHVTFSFGSDGISTHPDLDKRVLSMKELLSQMKEQGELYKNANQDSLNYTKYKFMAKMENIILTFNNGELSESLYLSLGELTNYPFNAFLNLMVSKNLLWLSNYKNNESLNAGLKKYTTFYGRQFEELQNVIVSLSSKDLNKLAYCYVKQYKSSFEENEELAFYLAYISEYYLGNSLARLHYNNYLKKYPSGKYSLFVENKLNLLN
jgi:hypothetical protein